MRIYLLGLLIVINCCLKAQEIDGLVANYSFNEGEAKDDVSGKPAKLVGVSFVRDRFGNPGSALYLHGNYGSYLNLGTSEILKPKIGTVSLWFYIDNPMLKGEGLESNPIILTKSHSGDDFYEGYDVSYDFNLKKICATTTQSKLMQVTVHTTDTVALRKWHHVAITYDNDFLCLYLNGSLEAKMKKGFTSCFLKTDSVMVGNSANTKNKRFYNGSIDDIEIYNRVLNESEILKLYKVSDPKAYKGKLKILYVILAGLLGLACLILIISLYFKRRYKKEMKKNELQAKISSMEVKVIKAQMNPHFIFNSLNSLQHLILSNENEKAQIYLSKFSRLIRQILESNTRENISMADEIELIQKYLEIEALRFNNAFSYDITIDENIDLDAVYIPNFLVQPFIENAIWHGLLPKKGSKKLKVNFIFLNEKTLICEIDDNGIGIKAPSIVTGSKTSLAIGFVRQRLELLSKMHGVNYGIEIINKTNSFDESGGTKVIVKFPLLRNND